MATKQKMGSEFREFFIDQLKDIYWAEQNLYKALEELHDAATSEELAAAFSKHRKETQDQIKKVEEVFKLMGEKAEAKKCEAMAGIIEEAQEVIKDTEKESYTRDAGLIMAAQKAEHYEIASYGTMRIFAGHMGEDEVKSLLEEILEQEKATDVSLTEIAESFVNEHAVAE